MISYEGSVSRLLGNEESSRELGALYFDVIKHETLNFYGEHFS